MSELCFFKKGKHIAALEISDAEKSAQLTGEGGENSFKRFALPMLKVHSPDWQTYGKMKSQRSTLS